MTECFCIQLTVHSIPSCNAAYNSISEGTSCVLLFHLEEAPISQGCFVLPVKTRSSERLHAHVCKIFQEMSFSWENGLFLLVWGNSEVCCNTTNLSIYINPSSTYTDNLKIPFPSSLKNEAIKKR